VTDADPIEAMRAVAREVVREVVPEILAAGARASGNGHAAAARDHAPAVPPPPVAAVLRPSTWTGPALPGEVIGDGTLTPFEPQIAAQRASRAATAAGPRREAVTLDSDEDLEHFVRTLVDRLENPAERRAVRTGRLQFTLRGASGAPKAPGAPEAPTVRIAKGAVTERMIRDAAKRGARLVLARGAVLTPLARDQARTLGVEIEKEARC
jgi:hypothetical protein